MNYPQIEIPKKTGDEHFLHLGEAQPFDVKDFWKWAYSDLLGNTARGVLAEYIVAKALGIAAKGVRIEWDPYDLETVDGLRIEVKSSAFLQSWHQDVLSKVQFSVRKTRDWDPKTGQQSPTANRSSDVYVFALLAHTSVDSIDPLDLSQWEFYVVPTKVIDEELGNLQRIGLASLRSLHGDGLGFASLSSAVAKAGEDPNYSEKSS